MLTSSRRSRLSLVKEYRRCLESRGNSQHVGEPRTLTKLTVLSTCIGCQKLKGDHRNTTDSGLWSVQVIRPPGPSSSLTGEEIHFGHKNRPQRPSGGVPPGCDSNAAETARCGPAPRRKTAGNARNDAQREGSVPGTSCRNSTHPWALGLGDRHDSDSHGTRSQSLKLADHLVDRSPAGEHIIHEQDLTTAQCRDHAPPAKWTRAMQSLRDGSRGLGPPSALTKRLGELPAIRSSNRSCKHRCMIDATRQLPPQGHRNRDHERFVEKRGPRMPPHCATEFDTKNARHGMPALELHRTDPAGEWLVIGTKTNNDTSWPGRATT